MSYKRTQQRCEMLPLAAICNEYERELFLCVTHYKTCIIMDSLGSYIVLYILVLKLDLELFKAFFFFSFFFRAL